MRTKVVVKFNDQEHKEYLKGEAGYIDGYIKGGDNRPYVVVVIGDRLTMIPFHCLEVVESKQSGE
jgi:hypothetical protein